MRYPKLSNAELARLLEGAQTLEADSHGPKVFRLRDGSFLKLFRRKRLLSSAFWAPYSQRFCDNAARLQQLGIPTLTPERLFQLESPTLTAVHYRPLAGLTLKQLSEQPGFDWQSLLPALVDLIRRLHALGIYFRSLHLGNIVQTPEGMLGLIDISDMRFYRRALGPALARRNLGHFQRYLRRQALEHSFPFDALRTALAHRGPGRS